MGFTCVAVLHNDFIHEIDRNGGSIGIEMADAMRRWAPPTRVGEDPLRRRIDGDFHVGQVIHRDHASAHQVVVVHGNTGCHVSDAKDVSYLALDQMAECLRRHGWSAAPPKTKRAARRQAAAKKHRRSP
jgi:hypothetical protein